MRKLGKLDYPRLLEPMRSPRELQNLDLLKPHETAANLLSAEPQLKFQRRLLPVLKPHR